MVGFLVASRIPNLLVIGCAQFATASFLLADNHEVYSFKFGLFLLSNAMIGAGGYIINDYFDQKIDMINRPHRVVVGTGLRRRLALFAHAFLTISGIALGFLIDPVVGLIHIFSSGALFTYSSLLKRLLLIGTLTISFLASLSLLIVMIYFKAFSFPVVVYALFGCVTIFIRESLKDIISAKGEVVFGVHSVPIVWGIRKAKLLILLVSLVGVSVLVFYLLFVPDRSVKYFFMGVLLLITWLFYKLFMADRVSDFEKIKKSVDVLILLWLISTLFV